MSQRKENLIKGIQKLCDKVSNLKERINEWEEVYIDWLQMASDESYNFSESLKDKIAMKSEVPEAVYAIFKELQNTVQDEVFV